MDKALSELVAISNTVGKDRTLVQGVGGNTSVKSFDEKYTYIKASGTALENMSRKKGWRRLNTQAVRNIFLDKSLAKMDVNSRERDMVQRLQAACEDETTSGARPSVESPLHVILDRYVIHLHALAVLSYVSAKNGKSHLFGLFEDEPFPPLWVPYANPGFSLGWKAFRLVNRYIKQYGRKPSVMFMEKHGLLVAADDPVEALELVRKVIQKCEAGLKQVNLFTIPQPTQNEIAAISENIKKAVLDTAGLTVNVTYVVDKTIVSVLACENVNKLLRPPALTPDEMGFVASPLVYLADGNPKTAIRKIKACMAKGQKTPVAFLVNDIGLFIACDKNMEEIIRDIVVGSLFIRNNAFDLGGINPLNKSQRDFMQNWEAEKFRVDVAAHDRVNS